MKYYQIIKDNEFIGIASSRNFVKTQKKHSFLANTDEAHGEFLLLDGILYRTTWMQPLPQKEYNYVIADIIEISEERYQELEHAIETAPEESHSPIIITPDKPEIEQDDEVLLEYIRNSKINEMSYECNKEIENGIDYNEKHYSLTQYDQINLLSAQLAIMNGAQSATYHADGETYREYSAAEINELAALANEHKNTILQKYNHIKVHIKTLTTINEISAVQWE